MLSTISLQFGARRSHRKFETTVLKDSQATCSFLARSPSKCWSEKSSLTWCPIIYSRSFLLWNELHGRYEVPCRQSFTSGVYSTFWVRGPIYIFHIILRAAVIADHHHGYIKHNHRCMGGSPGDVGEVPISQVRRSLILQPLHRFTYVTAHSPTLPPLYLRHSSFYSPSVASPTS